MNNRRSRQRGSRGDRKIGPWIIGDKLGGGGNADVYSAVHESTGVSVALKVVRRQVRGREPYLRFVREVRFLRNLTIDDGALPLIDANVPDEPTPKIRHGWQCR
jgi:serine/threonine protein kinase